MRTVAKSHHQNIPPAPPSLFQRANTKKKISIPKEFSPKRMPPLTPGPFKRIYSQQLTRDLAMIKRIESIVAQKEDKPKPSRHREYSAPNDKGSTMKTGKKYSAPNDKDSTMKTGKEYSAPSDKDSTMKKNATNSSDLEMSESVDSDDSSESDSIEEFDISDDAGRENTPAEEVSVDESGPKEDESRDAEGKNRTLPL